METKTEKLIVMCPICGRLHVDEAGNIDHPAMEKALASRLRNGFERTYTLEHKETEYKI